VRELPFPTGSSFNAQPPLKFRDSHVMELELRSGGGDWLERKTIQLGAATGIMEVAA
jgi:hypothetical protein